MLKYLSIIISGILLASLLMSCTNEGNENTPVKEDVIAWEKLTGVWQSYSGSEEEGNRIHNELKYIQDSGDKVAFYNCSDPAILTNEEPRNNNVIGNNENYLLNVVSENEIHLIDTQSDKTVGGYLKIENVDEFITGSLLIDVIDSSNGVHWPENSGEQFCVKIGAVSGEQWWLKIYTKNMIIQLVTSQVEYVGDYTPHVNSSLQISSKTSNHSLLAQDGVVSCRYNVTNDLHCVFNIIGLGETAVGEFTIYDKYLISNFESIDK